MEKIIETYQYDQEKNAIRGCLLGGAIGDALGSPVEFLSLNSIAQVYGDAINDYVEFSDGTGAITDDTQMALFTAEGILRANVRGREKGICDVASVVKYAYLRWLFTQGIKSNISDDYLYSGWLINEKQLFSSRAPGMTCLHSLEYGSSNTAKNDSKGCGTVMRMAPVGLFFEPQSAYEYGCDCSAITHGHQTGITAGGAFAMLISYLRSGKSLEDSLDLVENHLETIPEAKETLAAIRLARTTDNIVKLGEGWVAEEALAIGIYCALHHQLDFKAGVLEAINITGNSDSTGTIAGHILGIINGENGIPEKWRKNLREYAIVSQVADDLCTKFEENSAGHVTKNWWNKYPGY